MAAACVRLLDSTGPLAPAALLGANLEMYGSSTRDLGSDRLENPKFAGPETQATGVARGWHTPSYNYQGVHYELVAGDGLLGSNAQMIQSTARRAGTGIVQPSCWIRRGEKLEVSAWARVNHHPVTLRVGVRPAGPWSHDYASATLAVTSACWHEYRAELEIPTEDDAAVFFCFLEEPGQLYLDQVHLRPAGEGWFRSDVRRALGEFGVPQLRYPGGCITTAYHWRYGTGPHYLRPVQPDPVFKGDLPYEFGTDEYLEFCREYGIRPHLTVNVGTGAPEEAAEWAAYCADWYRARDLEPPLIYWQLGNEHYGYWERAHMTGEMYAAAVAELAPGIRAAYPKARIVALGQESTDDLYEAGRKHPWRAPLLDRAAQHVDALALQVYSTVAIYPDAAVQHRAVLDNARWSGEVLRQAVADLDGRGLDLGLGMSEWNLWIHASHFAPHGFYEPYDIQHGLFAASMFHHFLRAAPRMEFANFYQLLGSMGLFQVEKTDIHKTHVAEVFSLYREALPGEVLPMEVASPEAAEGVAALEAVATRSEAGIQLFLVNRSLEETLRVRLEGFGDFRTGTALIGAGPLEMEAEPAPLPCAGDQVELPPLSIARMTA